MGVNAASAPAPKDGLAGDRKTFWPWRVGAGILFPIIGLLARTVIVHGERLPKTGPVIVASNHISILDPTYLVRAMWKLGRLARFLAKASIWKVPVIGRVMADSGQIPVDRSGGAAGSLSAAEQLVESGSLLLVYPEATLSRDPAMWPMKGKTGAARLALESGVPLVPIAHWGAQEVLPPYGRLRPFPRKTVRVLIGEPLDLTPWHGRPIDHATLDEVTEVIMDAITALEAELRGETPPAHRWNMAVDGDPYRRAAKAAER